MKIITSKQTEEDLINIFFYSLENFGVQQADKYVRSLHECFQTISEHPEIGRMAEDIKPSMRRYVYGKHIILYRICEADILITRIIHHSEDSENYNL